jgi:hypothetical protein
VNQKEKVLENRLRRMAGRQGLRLIKSRARDRNDVTYGGYELWDFGSESRGLEDSRIVYGSGGVMNRGYAASLQDIEAFLTSDPAKRLKTAEFADKLNRLLLRLQLEKDEPVKPER